jgi:hypothetical protein
MIGTGAPQLAGARIVGFGPAGCGLAVRVRGNFWRTREFTRCTPGVDQSRRLPARGRFRSLSEEEQACFKLFQPDTSVYSQESCVGSLRGQLSAAQNTHSTGHFWNVATDWVVAIETSKCEHNREFQQPIWAVIRVGCRSPSAGSLVCTATFAKTMCVGGGHCFQPRAGS